MLAQANSATSEVCLIACFIVPISLLLQNPRDFLGDFLIFMSSFCCEILRPLRRASRLLQGLPKLLSGASRKRPRSGKVLSQRLKEAADALPGIAPKNPKSEVEEVTEESDDEEKPVILPRALLHLLEILRRHFSNRVFYMRNTWHSRMVIWKNVLRRLPSYARL
eukprot:s4151_g6.t1